MFKKILVILGYVISWLVIYLLIAGLIDEYINTGFRPENIGDYSGPANIAGFTGATLILYVFHVAWNKYLKLWHSNKFSAPRKVWHNVLIVGLGATALILIVQLVRYSAALTQ